MVTRFEAECYELFSYLLIMFDARLDVKGPRIQWFHYYVVLITFCEHCVILLQLTKSLSFFIWVSHKPPGLVFTEYLVLSNKDIKGLCWRCLHVATCNKPDFGLILHKTALLFVHLEIPITIIKVRFTWPFLLYLVRVSQVNSSDTNWLSSNRVSCAP